MKRIFKVIDASGSYWPKEIKQGDVVYSVDGYALPFQEGHTAIISKLGHERSFPCYGIPLTSLEELSHSNDEVTK